MATFEEILEQDGQLLYTNVGTSMLPLIRQGKDLVLIERKGPQRLKAGDVPLYKRADGTYILHRIIKVRINDYVLCGDNQCIPEYGITDNQIIGVLRKVIRPDGTELSVESEEYKRYMRKINKPLWLRKLRNRIKRFLRSLRPKKAQPIQNRLL